MVAIGRRLALVAATGSLLLTSRAHAADPVVSGLTIGTCLRRTASLGFQLADPAGHIVTVTVCVSPPRAGGAAGPCTGATLVAQGTFDTPDDGSAGPASLSFNTALFTDRQDYTLTVLADDGFAPLASFPLGRNFTIDNTAPTITQIVHPAQDACYDQADVPVQVTATDNFTATPVVTSSTTAAGCVRTTTITVADDCGNSTTATRTTRWPDPSLYPLIGGVVEGARYDPGGAVPVFGTVGGGRDPGNLGGCYTPPTATLSRNGGAPQPFASGTPVVDTGHYRLEVTLPLTCVASPVVRAVEFDVSTLALTTLASGAGSGRMVGATPGGSVDCAAASGLTSGRCVEIAPDGSAFAVAAVAAAGSRFVGWTGCASVYGAQGELCETALAGASVAVTAAFGNPLLTVQGYGTGSGTVSSSSPSGAIACTVAAGATSGDCSEEAADGTPVTLVATPSAGSQLNGWVGCDSTSGTNGEECHVALSGTNTVVAAFGPLVVTSAESVPMASPWFLGALALALSLAAFRVLRS